MKKLFSILAAITVFTLSANAQSTFQKGGKFVEGTVSYTKENSDVEYTVAPTVGYFMTNRVAVGVSAELGKNNVTDVTTTNVGVFARCYFLTVGKNLMVYSQADLGSSSTKVGGASTSEFAAGLGLGANYFVTNRIALSTHLCDFMTYKSSSGNSSLSLGFTGVMNPIATPTFGVLVKL